MIFVEMGSFWRPFVNSLKQERYIQEINGRIALLTDSNNKPMANIGNTPQSTNMANTHANMPGQPSVPPTMINQIPNTFPQGFPPQLQRQMQASPIPSQSRTSQTAAPGQQTVTQHQVNNQQLASRLTPAENAQINNLSYRWMQNATQAQKDAIFARFQSLPPEQRQELERNNVDPVAFQFRQRAIQIVLQHKQQQQQQMMQQGGGPVPVQDPNARLRNAAGMSQQRPNAQVRGPQTNNGFPGTQNIDATQFAGQQAQALHQGAKPSKPQP